MDKDQNSNILNDIEVVYFVTPSDARDMHAISTKLCKQLQTIFENFFITFRRTVVRSFDANKST